VKKRIIAIALLSLMLLLLSACMKKDDVRDYVASGQKMLYYMPGSSDPLELEVTVSMGRASKVSLTAENTEIDDYHTYTGLYTAPVGGTCVFGADGKRMANAELPSSGVLYARGVGRNINVQSQSYSASELQAFGAPKTVTFGERLPEKLPVVEKEGYTFAGWGVGTLGLITDKDGVVFEQYRTIDQNYIDRAIKVIRNQQTKEFMSLRLYLTPYFDEIPVTVTFDYNDGTYRQTAVSRLKGKPLSDFDIPAPAKDMVELVGWSTDPHEYVPFEGVVSEDVTLYAIWRDYRYAYVTEWKGQERIEKVADGETLVLGTPEREGYTFDGWYDNEYYIGLPIADPNAVPYGSLRQHYWVRWTPNE